jgi:hypothetical protein
MRASSDQPMSSRVVLALAFLALGCGEPEAPVPTAGATPSPLLSMDPERLWILLWAREDMDPSCGKFYESPEDPRYSDRRGRCERWELNATEMLRANGVADVRVEHLREEAFWRWYGAVGEQIAQCSADALRSNELPASSRQTASMSCDPYRKLTQVERRSVADIGIRVP